MSHSDRTELLLEELLGVQTAILKLLAMPLVEAATTQAETIVRLHNLGLTNTLINEATGASPDNIRKAIKRASSK